MTTKSRQIWIVLGLLVVAGVAWLVSDRNDPQGESQEGLQQGNGQGDSGNQSTVQEIPNALEGELSLSSDKKRGNLMLLLNDSDRVIYLNTSRDFSSLVGKQVTVTIEGSLDDFVLKDIVAR